MRIFSKYLFVLFVLIFGLKLGNSQQNDTEDENPNYFPDELPFFQGCELAESTVMREKCSHEKIIQFISQNLNYPETAYENGISGTVYVHFIIDQQGDVQNVQILRGIGNGCDEEAVRVATEMPRWNPGRKAGKSVSVRYTLPIRFKL